MGHKIIEDGCPAEAKAGQEDMQVAVMISFIMTVLILVQMEKDLYFCKNILICLQARKNSGSKC